MNRLFFIFIFLLTFILPNELKGQDKEKWKVSLIPTMGQIKNKKYLKAGVLALAQSYSVYKSLGYNKDDKSLKEIHMHGGFLVFIFMGL